MAYGNGARSCEAGRATKMQAAVCLGVAAFIAELRVARLIANEKNTDKKSECRELLICLPINRVFSCAEFEPL